MLSQQPRFEGRSLVNDTKAPRGKLINFRPGTLICNSSFFRHESEIDPLPKRIGPSNPHHYPVAYGETHLTPSPRDSLTRRIKYKKVMIKRRNTNHSNHERLF